MSIDQEDRMNVPIGVREWKKKIETIFRFLMASVPATQQRNEVEVSGRVCDMVHDGSVLKTPQKDIVRHDCTSQAAHCALLYLRHMCNSTHIEASERR